MEKNTNLAGKAKKMAIALEQIYYCEISHTHYKNIPDNSDRSPVL